MADTAKVVINLATGLEDAERVTVAFLVGGAAVERGKQVTIFLTKEAVRLALPGYAEPKPMVYAGIYEDSCEVGFEAAEQSGLRVILGKMMMDLGSYGQLQPKKILSVSLVESERLCRKWHGAADGRLAGSAGRDDSPAAARHVLDRHLHRAPPPAAARARGRRAPRAR
jgi:predicted peroxiredoxin